MVAMVMCLESVLVRSSCIIISNGSAKIFMRKEKQRLSIQLEREKGKKRFDVCWNGMMSGAWNIADSILTRVDQTENSR